MLHLVEAYWAAADALRTLVAQPMERNQWLEFAREHAEKEFIQGDIRRAEAASTVTLKNALELYLAEGLVRQTTSGTGRKKERILQLAPGRSADEIAFRRDDIGAFLIRFGETAARKTSTPIPSDTFPMLADEAAEQASPTETQSDVPVSSAQPASLLDEPDSKKE